MKQKGGVRMHIAEINGGTVVWLLCVGGAAALF